MTGDLRLEVDALLMSNLSIHWMNWGGTEEDSLHVHCDITVAAWVIADSAARNGNNICLVKDNN